MRMQKYRIAHALDVLPRRYQEYPGVWSPLPDDSCRLDQTVEVTPMNADRKYQRRFARVGAAVSTKGSRIYAMWNENTATLGY
jgi:hypothetical protein